MRLRHCSLALLWMLLLSQHAAARTITVHTRPEGAAIYVIDARGSFNRPDAAADGTSGQPFPLTDAWGRRHSLELVLRRAGYHEKRVTIPEPGKYFATHVQWPAEGAEPLDADLPTLLWIWPGEHRWLLLACGAALCLAVAFLVPPWRRSRALAARLAALGASDSADPWVRQHRRIDRWVVVERLGAGGMGTVYRVTPADEHVGESFSALKVLSPEVSQNADLARRFRREIELSRALHHRNIVHVEDFGEHDGQLYLVLEYVDGPSLRALLEAGPPPLEQALDIVDDVLEALCYLHERGMLHRDVKPSNILLTSGGLARLSDFGLAITLARDVTTEAQVGTLRYMAPELIASSSVTPAVDQYALGIVATEVLAGRHAACGEVAERMTASEPTARYPHVAAALEAWRAAR
jgi:hypothetical protein